MQKVYSNIKTAASTRKGRRIILVIVLVIAVLVAGGLFYWNYNKKFLIRNKLEDAIEQKTAGLYAIKYGDLQLDEVGGNLTIRNLRLTYDSSKYADLRQQQDAPPVLLKIHIPSIIITGVKTPRALLDKEVVGKKLQINSPIIDIYYTHAGKDSARNTPTREVYEQILGGLNLIKIDTVEFNGAEIRTHNLKTGKQLVTLSGMTLKLVDLAVDSTAQADSTRLLFAREMGFHVTKVSWSSANKLYDYSIDSVQLNSATREMHVSRFHMDPTLGEDAFVKSLPTQDDRFDFRFSGIEIKDLDFPSLLNEQLIADNILIRSSTLKVYRDLSIKRDNKNRVGKYPHQLFSKLPILVQVKKLVMPGCFVEYKEKNPRSDQAGKVQFHQTSAVITNLNNQKGLKENIMTAEVKSMFLNAASLTTSWKFYLSNPNGRFDLKGRLGSIDAKKVNQISEPMGPARLEDGKVNSFEFNLSGSDRNINGQVAFLYDDLKVAVLEKEEGEKKLDKKNVTSFVANIMIKNSNPSGKKTEARRIDVSMARDTNRSIFYFIWKTLFKGIQETVGIKKK